MKTTRLTFIHKAMASTLIAALFAVPALVPVPTLAAPPAAQQSQASLDYQFVYQRAIEAIPFVQHIAGLTRRNKID